MDVRPVLNILQFLITVGTLMTSFGDRLNLSEQSATWDEAVRQCKHSGGRLVSVSDVDDLHQRMQKEQPEVTLEGGRELWVGGHLVDSGWRWEGGNTSTPFQDPIQQIERDGCYRQKTWKGGTRLPNISAAVCLDYCNWQGPVGLKSNYCLCEPDIDIAKNPETLCHMTCAGNHAELCGGIPGISIYHKGSENISWADGEPGPQHDCGLLRQGDQSPPELLTSTCQLQTRYLCRFINDDKCGTSHTCIRWSTEQVTWRDAKRRCEILGGELVDLGTARSDNMRELPPGTFWVALRRRRRWTWLDGSAIPFSAFYSHQRILNPAKNCSVLVNVKDKMVLSPRSCRLMRRYLCQHDDIGDIAIKRDAINNNTVSPVIGNIHPTTSGSTGMVDGVGQGTDEQTHKTNRGIANWTFSSCELLVLGFVSGMLCMLVVGSVCIVIVRYRTPRPKHQRSRPTCDHRSHDMSASYTPSAASVRLAGLPAGTDGMYATASDTDTHSPFRQTQQIRRGNLTSRCKGATTHNDGTPGGNVRIPEYTWRGVIDGKIEIINTELRPPPLYKEQDGNEINVKVSIQKDATQAQLKDRVTATDKVDVSVEGSDAGFGDYDIPFPSSSNASSEDTSTRITPPTTKPGQEHDSTGDISAITQSAGVQDDIYASVRKVRTPDQK